MTSRKQLISTRALADEYKTSNIMALRWLEEAGLKPVRQEITKEKHFKYWDPADARAVMKKHRERIDARDAVREAKRLKTTAHQDELPLEIAAPPFVPPALKIVGVPMEEVRATVPQTQVTPTLTPVMSIQDIARDKTISQIYFEIQTLSSKIDKILKALDSLNVILTMPEEEGSRA